MTTEAEELTTAVQVGARTKSSPEALVPRAAPLQVPRPRIEKLIAITLLIGVLASTALVLFGGMVYVYRHSHAVVDYRVFRGQSSDLRTLNGMWWEVKQFSGRGIIQVGLMLLVALQVVRVMLTGVLFIAGRDWIFVLITSIVLALLAYGLIFESAVAR